MLVVADVGDQQCFAVGTGEVRVAVDGNRRLSAGVQVDDDGTRRVCVFRMEERLAAVA
jgi:hypothetical protein